jgi:hypothetical protein
MGMGKKHTKSSGGTIRGAGEWSIDELRDFPAVTDSPRASYENALHTGSAVGPGSRSSIEEIASCMAATPLASLQVHAIST